MWMPSSRLISASHSIISAKAGCGLTQIDEAVVVDPQHEGMGRRGVAVAEREEPFDHQPSREELALAEANDDGLPYRPDLDDFDLCPVEAHGTARRPSRPSRKGRH